MSDCPCPHHPFECYGHPHSCECSRQDGPFVEFGVGWAKIHFRRELIEHDRTTIAEAVATLTSQERK